MRTLTSKKICSPCRAGGALLLVFAACCCGCGGDESLGTVTGSVTLDGDPVTTGTVQFLPTSGRGAKGKIRDDGSFTLGTYGESDGASVGMHKVAIIAYEPGTGERPDPTKRSTHKALVPTKYLSPGASGLTFEVKPGDNYAPFELVSR